MYIMYKRLYYILYYTIFLYECVFLWVPHKKEGTQCVNGTVYALRIAIETLTRANKHMHTQIYTYSNTHTSKQTYTHTNIHIHTHASKQKYTNIITHTNTHPHKQTNIHTHTYIYIYIYIHSKCTYTIHNIYQRQACRVKFQRFTIYD